MATGVLQMEGLHDHLSHRVSVEREGEAESDGDDETSHEDERIERGVGVEHVGRGVAAEGEVAGEGVEEVEHQDEQIGEEDHHAHTLPRRPLHVAHHRDKLNLRAVAEAEDGQHHEDVLVQDETLQRAAQRVGLAALAEQGTLIESRVVRQRRIRLDHALPRLAGEVGHLGQTAGVGAQRSDQHHHRDVDDTGDGEHGGVAKGSDLAHQRRRQDDKDRYDHQQPSAVGQKLNACGDLSAFRDKGHAQIKLVGNNNGISAARTDAVKELHQKLSRKIPE